MNKTNNQRINAGYTITDSIQIGAIEFVLGEHATAPSRYVTWECRDGSNYYWGHYLSDRLDAVKDLLGRAGQELDYQMSRKTRAVEAHPKKSAEGREQHSDKGKEHER